MHTQNPSPFVRDRVEHFNGKQLIYVGWTTYTMSSRK